MGRNWLGLVILAGLFYVAGQYVASQPQRVEQEVQAGREITVQGTGKAYATPDVAKYTLSIVTGPQASAEVALERLSTRSAAMIDAVKAEGVKKEDIATTNLSINPIYDFPPSGQQTLRGFEAAQSIEVTIRDLTNIGAILSRATGEGVNVAGGLRFEVDDIGSVRLEAQQKAIEDAKQKGEQLADTLGVNLGRVKTFAATDGGPVPPPIFARALESDVGGGTPEVPAGTQEVMANVTVTYELR